MTETNEASEGLRMIRGELPSIEACCLTCGMTVLFSPSQDFPTVGQCRKVLCDLCIEIANDIIATFGEVDLLLFRCAHQRQAEDLMPRADRDLLRQLADEGVTMEEVSAVGVEAEKPRDSAQAGNELERDIFDYYRDQLRTRDEREAKRKARQVRPVGEQQ